MSTRVFQRGAGRGVLALLALATLLTFDGAAASAADDRTKDLTPEIAAIRRSQIASENAMRHADKKLKSLQRARKVGRKRIHHAEKRLARVRERRADARHRLASTAARLAEARREAERELNVRPQPLSLRIGSVSTAWPLIAWAGEAMGDAATRPDPSAAGSLGSRSTLSDADIGVQIAQLEREMKRLQRAVRKAERRTRHAMHAKRARIRAVARMKRATKVTISRRESAEAVLGSNIMRMTNLAQQRAHRQVELKPGETEVRFGWPHRGRISQGYHRGHDGIDIVGGHGSLIKASADGVVSYVGWNPFDKGRRAFVVVIGHPGGYETIYGHLLPIRRVTIGHLVEKGQPIGHMGSTGNSTGTHVHWEVSRDFQQMNPLSVL